MTFNRWMTGCLVALLCTLPIAAENENMQRVFPYDSHVATLDNGLKVILIPMSSEGLVAYWTVVRTGSRDEYEPGHSGFAHFFEHMMFRGTEKYPADVYNGLLTGIGADTNAYTTDDLTAYHLGIAAEDLEQVMELEADRFTSLAYAEPEFRTEAGAVYGEYRKNRMSPFFQIFEAMMDAAYTEHTYGHTTMGYERDIKQMPEMYEYSKRFFSRYYRPENVVLMIAGSIDVEETMALAKKYYGGWEPGYQAPKIPVEPEQTEERAVEVTYEGRSLPIVAWAYKTDEFDPGNKRYLAAGLLADLAFGETSDVHKKLVLDEQVVEFISASQDRNRDPGLFTIFTRIKDPEKIDYVQAELAAVIEKYRTQAPDAERLAALKSRRKYSFLMNLDTPDSVASAMARIVALTGGIEAEEQRFRAYETIGPEEIRQAAEHYLVPQRRTVVVLEGSR